MNRTFRILLIDDDFAPDIAETPDAGAECNWTAIQCGVIAKLLPRQDVELIVAADAALSQVWRIPDSGASTVIKVLAPHEHPSKFKDMECDFYAEFLSKADVILLDIGNIGPSRDWSVFQQAAISNFAKLGLDAPDQKLEAGRHDGIGFFHLCLERFSKNSLVIILTQYDSSADSLDDAYLHAFTVQDFSSGCGTSCQAPDLPYVVKFDKKSQNGNEWISDLVEGHYDFFQSDLSEATNRFQISFAASHDQPVMIVGESGTGKEGIAKFIHKQWARRKNRLYQHHKAGRFQVINCGGLSEHMAHSELFGYIKGSFTGADEHRLGKAFIAAGIDPLSKGGASSNGPSKLEENAKEALAGLKSGFDQLDRAEQENKWDVFRRKVLPHLNQFFRRDGTGPPLLTNLITALKQIEKALNTATKASANSEFHRSLQEKSASLLRSPATPQSKSNGLEDYELNEWDLEYALDEPIGTLFLDEFADLPLPVQTLLLRFLQSGEVQPHGFSGRVLGLKVRIIVATSDSRVAEFAGTPVTDDFRTEEELARPLRNDLLHRVRFQVIRAEPVVADNIERILREMIARKPAVVWHEDAIGYFVAEIKKMIQPGAKPRPATKPGFIRRASFGHRRELQRVVDLVWEYSKSVSVRGVRDAGLKMTKAGSLEAQKGLIERLWRPAMIVSTDRGASKATQVETVKNEDLEGARALFVAGINGILGKALDPENWTWDRDVQGNRSLVENSGMVNAVLKKVFRTYRGEAKEESVRWALAGPGFRGSEPKKKNSFFKKFPPAQKSMTPPKG